MKKRRKDLSSWQKHEAYEYSKFYLASIFKDPQDRFDVYAEIKDDILEDIRDNSGWTYEIGPDEICEGDIQIALARVLKQRICGE